MFLSMGSQKTYIFICIFGLFGLCVPKKIIFIGIFGFGGILEARGWRRVRSTEATEPPKYQKNQKYQWKYRSLAHKDQKKTKAKYIDFALQK